MTDWTTRIKGPVAVIGDLHGQTDKLRTVLEKLRKLPDFEQRWIVFIGDFVDRGPDTRGTIDAVLGLMKKHPRTTAICGNHEYAMCCSLGWIPSPEGAAWGDRWSQFYDSDTTFASYGATHGDLPELTEKVPAAHREFLTSLPWCVEHPEFLFVHAGLDPLAPYDMQLRILQRKDFTLNRPQWLFSKTYVDSDPPQDCPLTVVSGHVRVPNVIVRSKRILIDTTGGTDGDLSCVLLPEKTILTSGEGTQPVAATNGDKPARSWWRLFG